MFRRGGSPNGLETSCEGQASQSELLVQSVSVCVTNCVCFSTFFSRIHLGKWLNFCSSFTLFLVA